MANVSGIRDQIQTRLDTLNTDGQAKVLRPYDVATGKERMPCSIVFPQRVERITSGGATYQYNFMIEVYVSLKQGLARAQDEMDAFVDPTATNSIRAAIEGDDTLAGTVDDLAVGGFTTYQFAELNGNTGKPNSLVARIPLEVWA